MQKDVDFGGFAAGMTQVAHEYRQAIIAAIREAHKNRGHAAALRHIERNLIKALGYESYAQFEIYEGKNQ